MRLATFLLPLALLACDDATDKDATDDAGATDGSDADTTDGDGASDGTDETDGTDGASDGTDGASDGTDGGAGLTVGNPNPYAEAGCEMMDDEPVSIALGASASEANTAVVVPNDTTTWLLEMPPTGDGWFTVEIADWMTVVHLMGDDGATIEVQGGEAFTEVMINGSCPDAGITDQRYAFHDWGAYTVRVAEGAPAEVWFTVVKEE